MPASTYVKKHRTISVADMLVTIAVLTVAVVMAVYAISLWIDAPTP
jgi:hypothetical protein